MQKASVLVVVNARGSNVLIVIALSCQFTVMYTYTGYALRRCLPGHVSESSGGRVEWPTCGGSTVLPQECEKVTWWCIIYACLRFMVYVSNVHACVLSEFVVLIKLLDSYGLSRDASSQASTLDCELICRQKQWEVTPGRVVFIYTTRSTHTVLVTLVAVIEHPRETLRQNISFCQQRIRKRFHH